MNTQYCHFKPDSVATYYCPSCHTYSCDEFSKEISQAECRCFLCNADLESLGTGSSAEPFWRRLDKTFRYPFSLEAAIFIIGTSILSVFLRILPGFWSIIFQLIITSAFIKYCFVCLQSTALGDMKPPSMVESYNDGIFSLLKILFVFFGIFGMCFLAFKYLGMNFGALISVLLICALPASLIILAIDDSPLSAINPIKLGWIIKSVGLGYGVLLAFIMMMSSSVAVLSSVFEGFSILGNIIESFISSYYAVVMFHMMGYMIFQYQSKLGFTARDDSFTRVVRTDVQKRQVNIKALLRNGDFEGVSNLYRHECKKNRSDFKLYKDYFKFLISIQDTKQLIKFGDVYLKLLTESNQSEDARLVYKQIRHLCPEFKPSSPYVRYALAKYFHEVTEGLQSVHILNGLHKDNPDFDNLPEAYMMCAEILRSISGKEVHAEKFKKFSDILMQKRSQAEQQKTSELNKMLVAKDSPLPKKPTDQPEPTNNGQAETGSLAGLSLVPMDKH